MSSPMIPWGNEGSGDLLNWFFDAGVPDLRLNATYSFLRISEVVL